MATILGPANAISDITIANACYRYLCYRQPTTERRMVVTRCMLIELRCLARSNSHWHFASRVGQVRHSCSVAPGNFA